MLGPKAEGRNEKTGRVLAVAFIVILASIAAGCSEVPAATTVKGPPPLVMAVLSNDVSRVKTLLASGADVNSKGPIGMSPLVLAANMNQGHDLVQLLLAQGADVSIPDANGWTALHAAVRLNDLETVKNLISHGSHLNAKTKRGETPLIMCAQTALFNTNGIEITEILLQDGANPSVRDAYGRTAREILAGWMSKHGAGKFNPQFIAMERAKEIVRILQLAEAAKTTG